MTDSTYSEVAEVIDNLPLIVREARRARGVSQREMSRQSGVDNVLICRLEAGRSFDVYTLPAILRWLDHGAWSMAQEMKD